MGGINTYAGSTAVSGGTLQMGFVAPAGSQPVSLFNMNGPLGPAANGATVVDSIGGNNATLNGTGAELCCRQIRPDSSPPVRWGH